MMNGIAIFFSIVFLSCGYSTGYELSLANKEAELNQKYDRDPSVSKENRTPTNTTNTDSNTFNQNTLTEPSDPVNLSWQEINESDDPERTEHVLKNSDNSTINKILNGQQNLESLFDSINIPTDWKIAVATTPKTIGDKLIMQKNTSHFNVDRGLVIAALTRYREWVPDDEISNISSMNLYRELETTEIQLEYALLNEAFFKNNEETLEKLGEILGLIRYSSDCPQEDKNKAQNIRRSFQRFVNSQKESSDFYYVPFFTKEDVQKLLNFMRLKEINLPEGQYLIRFKFSETKKENSSDSQTITVPPKANALFCSIL